MGTREKILVGLMILALAYGAVEMFLIKPEKITKTKNTGSDIEAARQMKQKINKRIKQADLSSHRQYIIKLAGRQWNRDPFYVLPEQEEISKTDSGGKSVIQDFQYTGYLEIGDIKMAIINGVEYRSGQKLEKGGGVLQSISPGQVVIKSPDTGERISVPYSK